MVLTWQRKHCWLNVGQAPAHRGPLHVAPGGSAAQTRPLLAAPVLLPPPPLTLAPALAPATSTVGGGSHGRPAEHGGVRVDGRLPRVRHAHNHPHQLSFFAVATPNVIHVVVFSSSVGDFLGRVRIRSCADACALACY